MADGGVTGRARASRPAAKRSTWCWLTAATLLLAGCGFHLEGHLPLPQPIRAPYIRALDQQSDFVQSLRRQMLISGAHPVDTPDRASAVVDILDDAVTRRVLSVSAQNRPTEYQVTYTVRFRVAAASSSRPNRLRPCAPIASMRACCSPRSTRRPSCSRPWARISPTS